MEWFKDNREAQEVHALLTGWEFKNVVVYRNPLMQAWEVSGKRGQRFEDKDAAIASETRDGWQLFSVMEDGWVALPAEVEAAYESQAKAAVYRAFFQRHKH
jgi:hypothetical protein